MVTWEKFQSWTHNETDCDPHYLYHAWRICWRYLNRSNAKILHLGRCDQAWLRAIAHFAPHAAAKTVNVELDVWSPNRNKALPGELPNENFTLVTAFQIVQELYHPQSMLEQLFRAMRTGGNLILIANNAARWQSVMRLVEGSNLNSQISNSNIVREYVWRELNNTAAKCKFIHAGHGFFDTTDLTAPQDPLLPAIKPLLVEPDQLKSMMYLILRKATPFDSATRMAWTGVRQAYTKSGLSRLVETRAARWAISRRHSQ